MTPHQDTDHTSDGNEAYDSVDMQDSETSTLGDVAHEGLEDDTSHTEENDADEDDIDDCLTGSEENIDRIIFQVGEDGQERSYKLRELNDWSGRRPLLSIFHEDVSVLATMEEGYRSSKITLSQVESEIQNHTAQAQREAGVRTTSNFLQGSRAQMERCRNNPDVLLVIGWCPIMDRSMNLDQSPADASFTEQVLICIEEISGKQILLLNLFTVSALSLIWEFQRLIISGLLSVCSQAFTPCWL